MKRMVQYTAILSFPAIGKLLLLLLLNRFDQTQTAFANLFLIEAVAILIFSFSYCSFDTFITRHWHDISEHWILLTFSHLKYNGVIAIIALLICAVCAFFYAPIWVLCFAICNQYLINVGRVLYSALRLEKRTQTLASLLFAFSFFSNIIFVVMCVGNLANPLIAYLVASSMANTIFLIYFVKRWRAARFKEASIKHLKFHLENFNYKNKNLEFGTIVLQNIERGALFYLIPIEVLNSIAVLYKFLTALDLYSKFFKLINLDKILEYLDPTSDDVGFQRSRILFYLVGLPFTVLFSISLSLLLDLQDINLGVTCLFSLSYFINTTSFYFTMSLFRENRLFYNVICDSIALICILTILLFFDLSTNLILFLISVKFALSVIFRYYASLHVNSIKGV